MAATKRIKAETQAPLNLRPRATALAVSAALLPWGSAHALPGDPLTTVGTVVHSQPTSKTMHIDVKTQHAATSYRGGFSIGVPETVNVQQLARDSVFLIRDVSGNATNIFGTLTANGQIFLSNSNGVLFGRTATVEVGALFATTLSMSDETFKSGRYQWSREGTAGSVVNEGRIVTANGYTALVGPQVRNDGIIIARTGTAALVAADRVSLDLIGDGLISINVDQAALNASVVNTGSIEADGGRVLLTARSANALLDTVINNSGIIRANSLVERNGEIVLDGGSAGTVANSGTLQAAGTDAGRSGGTVKVLGGQVALQKGSRIDASGDAGGGTVLVGGNFHGDGPERNAAFTNVDAGALISADAVTDGDGGQVVVWADDTTRFHGQISARGGAKSGDGGNVEVSGKEHLYITGHADLRARNGRAGTLLLDPGTVTIIDHGNPTTGGPDTFSDAYINAQLALGNLTIDTDAATAAGPENINFQDSTISISWSTPNAFTLNAGHDIVVRGSVSGGAGSTLNLSFGRDGAGGTLDLSGATAVTAASVNATGGGGSDTIVAQNIVNTWSISGINSGTLNAITFSDVENLTGGTANDSFVLSDGVGVTGTISGNGGATNTLDYGAYSTAVTVDLQTGAATNTGGFTGINSFVGGTASDTLAGANVANTWTVNAPNAGDVNGTTFSSFENLTGGTSTDGFTLTGTGSVSGTIDGGADAATNNTLQARDVVNTWSITANNAGSVDSVNAFTNIGNLTGGTANDTFVLSNGFGVFGTIGGGGGATNTLDYGAYTTAVTVNLQAPSATNVGSFNGLNNFVGGAASDTLIGVNVANTWTVNAPNAGDVNGTTFSSFENLTGGTANDSFVLSDGVGVTGTISGNGGATNTLDYGAYSTAVTVDLQTGAATNTGGFTGINSFVGGTASDTLAGANVANTWTVNAPNAGDVNGTTFSSFENLTGGTSTDGFMLTGTGSVSGTINGGADAATNNTLQARDVANTWSITANNAGSVDSVNAFTNIGNLTGGTANDTFVLSNGFGVFGTIGGGGGATNTLDYGAYTTAVTVNLQAPSATNVGSFNGLNNFVGGAASDTLIGANVANTWTVNAPNAGDVNGTTFSSFENLTGGTSTDGFMLTGTGSVSGTINGGADAATNNTLQARDVANTWSITANNAGSVDSVNAFTNIGNLTGGTADDSFVLSDGVGVTGTISGGGGATNTLDYGAYSTAVTVNLQAPSATNVGSFNGLNNFVGGAASDTLIGANVANTWTVNAPNAGDVNGTTFSSFENLTGGTSTDGFTLTGTGSVSGTINGGADAATNNTLQARDVANTWSITANNAGSVDSVNAFTNIGNLTGGTANDTFVLSNGFGVFGTIGGGGGATNTLDYGAYTTAVTVNLQAPSATNVGSFNGLNNFVGGAASDTLIGVNVANTWTVNAPNAGDVNGTTFSSFENLTGGTSTDGFMLTGTGSVSGTINGGADAATNNTLQARDVANTWNITASNAGSVDNVNAFTNIGNLIGGTANDSFVLSNGFGVFGTISGNSGATNTLDYSAYTTPVSVNLQTASATNTGGIVGLNNFVGGTAGDTLRGANVTNTWNVTANNAGNVNGTVTFSSFEALVGGTANDSFVLSDGVGVTGTIAGGGGTTNTLDYSAYTTPVSVNLQAASATNTGGIVGLNNFVGGTAGDTLAGTNVVAHTWTVNAPDAGDVNGTTFSSFENLAGGTNTDSFTLTGTGTLSGTINGGGGTNTLTANSGANTWVINGANTGTVTGITGGWSNIQNLVGGSSTDSFTLAGGGTLTGTINGGAGTDTLTGDNVANTWTITGVNSGTLTGTGGWLSIENLVGGNTSDSFNGTGGSVAGTISDGGGGTTTLIGTITSGGNQAYTGAVSAGTVTLNAGAGSITATNAANDFTGTLDVNGASASVSDANALTIDANLTGGLTTSSGALTYVSGLSVGSLNSTASGAVTETGAITVAGATSISAGANGIALTSANDFGGAVTLSNSGANAVQIADANDISIASSTLGGNFTVTAGGGAGQIAVGSITNAGSQQYNGNLTMNGTYTTNGGAWAVTGNTILGSDSTISTSAGNVTFGGTINGGNSLTVNDSGTNNFMGAIGNATALANITTDAPGASILGGNVTVTGAINLLDATTANGITMASTGGGAITLNNANTASPASVNTTGDVTFTSPLIGTAGAPMNFTVTPDSVTMTQLVTAFFSGPAIPGTVVFPEGSSITFNGALIAQSIIQQQAAAAASTASSSVTAAIVEEANKTFGTDSVAEDVEYGFAGEIGATPPMDHRIDESGISLPRCVQEAREGLPCK